MSSPLSPIATCPDTNTNGPALTAGENGSDCPPAPVRVPPRNSTLIESSNHWLADGSTIPLDETKLQFIRFLGTCPAPRGPASAHRGSLWGAGPLPPLDAIPKERRLSPR